MDGLQGSGDIFGLGVVYLRFDDESGSEILNACHVERVEVERKDGIRRDRDVVEAPGGRKDGN